LPDEREPRQPPFTQVAAEDPTANADGTYTDETGADLRDRERFCLWCQEIVTLRILEKTDHCPFRLRSSKGTRHSAQRDKSKKNFVYKMNEVLNFHAAFGY
jgi:hypothetical protein